MKSASGYRVVPTSAVSLKFAMLAAMLLLCGCQKLTGEPTVNVVGKVTLDGSLVSDAWVLFVPIKFRTPDGTIWPVAVGKTNSGGRFDLHSAGKKSATLGDYRVLIFRDTDVQDWTHEKASLESRRDPQTETTLFDPLAAITGSSVSPITQTNAGMQANAGIEAESESRLPPIPERYNVYSELRCSLNQPRGVLYPKFELVSN